MYSCNKTSVVRVRVSQEQLEKLVELSSLTGFSVSEILRQLIEKL